MKINVLRYYPNGNTTAIIENKIAKKLQEFVTQKIINKKYAEQVAFVEKAKKKNAIARLQMMGGEFSGNATLAFGIYLSEKYEKSKVIFESSGVSCLIKSTIIKNKVQSEIPSNIKLDQVKKYDDYWTIPFPGIFQIIIPNVKPDKKIIRKLILKYKKKEKALALIFVTEKGNLIKINPFVWVNNTKTLINETSCGSGSIATAIWYYLNNNKVVKNLQIIQPTNKPTYISLYIKNKTVTRIFLKTKVQKLTDRTIALNENLVR